MILLTAVVAGLAAALLRAGWTKRRLKPLSLKLEWLVVAAFLPQLLVFHLPATRSWVPDTWAPVVLVTTQALLLVFAWANRKEPGFWALGVGLILNFTVIVLNGGLMPISPETIRHLAPDLPASAWQLGQRLGDGKDVVLLPNTTWLSWLSDRFTLPRWIPYRVAFSIGDMFIAMGAFILIWSLAGPNQSRSIIYSSEEGPKEVKQ